MAILADIVIEAEGWQGVPLDALAEQAFGGVAAHLGLEGAHEVALLACDDARIATLNADFRDKPQPTNVLSWPQDDLAADVDGASPARPRVAQGPFAGSLGDIAIAWETCQREAGAQGRAVEAHVTHLLVHGCLHLLGYDHVREKDAALMEGLEVAVLAKLGIANPY